MASPPFTGDTSNPADNAVVSQYPSNERTHRDEIISYLNTEHDSTTGHHAFPELTTTAKNALSTPPTGMLVYDTTLGKAQFNTGTSGSPIWTDAMPSSVPTGGVIDYAGTSAPTGYLACDGSAVSRTTYAALFAAIGTTWGSGDGSTTFNLPNFARRSTVGSGGTATGTLGNTVGSTGGEEAHTLATTELPHLSYNVNDPGHAHSYLSPTSGNSAPLFKNGGTPFNYGDNNSTGVSTTGITISDNNGGGGHNTYHPVAVVLKIIKT